ncbi:MAG: right-handed parallel beta-helix repeat-containing protein [Prevotellaceae bacterium]|jgi:hypothetical protein|nr:right-handed parallel beta-helix repeat-containing protein [Prevotellaceae bacterium]
MPLYSKIISFFLLSVSLSVIVVFSSCNDDNFGTNPAYKLSFSTDTISFDTVFTDIGSATTVLKVYNPSRERLKIAYAGLEKGASSSFRINVDGSSKDDNQFNNIEISAKDSLYIFITVNINPNNASSPVIEQDAIRFITNGNEQKVQLEAYGQDVEILRGLTIYGDSALTTQRPYLIYDSLIVLRKLTLPAGCKLYFYNSAHMLVLGSLQALGTREQPVSIRGRRMDNIDISIYDGYDNPVPYNYVSGQWNGIYLYGQNGKHILKHVNINSGEIGIYLRNDDIQSGTRPKLEIVNSRIHNFTYYGLAVQNGDVTVVNSEISNTGMNCLYLNGGKHTFVHCTIANFYGDGFQPASRSGNPAEPAVMIMDLNRIAPMESYFYNCVITGSIEKEFSLLTQYPEQYNGNFSHTYIRRAVNDTIATPQFGDIRWYQKNDTVFRHPSYDNKEKKYFDFMPDSVSPLRGLGNPDIITQFSQYNLELDLNGNSRTENEKPDAGAYQWMPAEVP